MTWKAIVQCPNCGKTRKFISYSVKNLTSVFGRSTQCWACGKHFTIKSEKIDNIVKDLGIS